MPIIKLLQYTRVDFWGIKGERFACNGEHDKWQGI